MNLAPIPQIIALLWAGALSLAALIPSAAASSSCLQCHSAMQKHEIKLCHAEWMGSIHARKHVTCENCHGGNPQEATKEKAHEGVYNAMNPISSTYYTKIPGLCGGCHKQELNDFQSTKHYHSLMDKGMGPHCITCHDSMSTKVLGPDEIETLCTVCHNRRNANLSHVSGLAKDILERMAEINLQLGQLKGTIEQTTKQGVNTSHAQGSWNLANRAFLACKGHWHTFQFARINGLLVEVENLLIQSRNALYTPKSSP